MAKFAVIDKDAVLNVIEAESKEVAELVTGHTCIEYTDEPAEPNGFYKNKTFIKAQPYPSWNLNGMVWEAPTPKPEDGGSYRWDEDTLSWIELPLLGDTASVLD